MSTFSRIFTRAFHLAHRVFSEGGMCLEFGVYEGGSFLWLANRILDTYPKSNLVGFDSWLGLPPEADDVWVPERHAKGQFSASKEDLLGLLRAIKAVDERFRLVDGFFRDSLTSQLRDSIRNLIFVNVDVDLYVSTVELLDFIGPLLRPGVVLYWDDWQDPNDEHEEAWGERRAWEEWYARHPEITAETLEINPANQRSMIITGVGDSSMTHKQIAAIRYECLRLEP